MTAGTAKPVEVDVFVPLYANTFPIVAFMLALKERGDFAPAFHEYDWTWNHKGQQPPFNSAASYQVFFATRDEFESLEDHGISFVPIPVTAFNPRYVFISARQTSRAASVVQKIWKHSQSLRKPLQRLKPLEQSRRGICTGCTSEGVLSGAAVADLASEFLWISDAPDQAELLAKWLQRDCLGIPDDPKIRLWSARGLQETIRDSEAGANANVKCFIWGGPLAWRAKYDVRWCAEPKSCPLPSAAGDTEIYPNMRAPGQATYAFELPSLRQWPIADSEDMQKRYITYCCIGYAESGSALLDYYATRLTTQHVSSKAAAERKIADVRKNDPVLNDLADHIEAEFQKLFQDAAQEKMDTFRKIQPLYDKHCRTRNPIAQLYTPKDFAACLKAHHENPVSLGRA